LRKNENGEIIETPEEMFKRVAHAIASVEKQYGKSDQEIEKIEKEFLEMLTSLEFLPNSPTLMNAGTDFGQLSACNVLPLEDSMESIFETVKNAALVQKAGGGTGFSFSKLRPKGDIVRSTGGVAAGPVFFLNAFDASLKGIRQAHRRFATNMGILRVDHPDILDFITAKHKEGTITTFNISVGITDEFMNSLENGGDFSLINPRNYKIFKKVSSAEIFNQIVESAWRNGEPGLVFLDRINSTEYNPVPRFGPIEATNPCVAEGTLVNTPNGYVPVEEIKVGDYIATVFGYEPVKSIERHEDVPVFKVKFSDGGEQIVTAAHRYYAIKKGSKSKKLRDYRLDELEVGDYVRVCPTPILRSDATEYVEGLKMGILLGDSCHIEDGLSENIIQIASYIEDLEFESNVKKLFRKDDLLSNSNSVGTIFYDSEAKQLQLSSTCLVEKTLDITQVHSMEKALGIIDGLLATNGDILLKSNHPQIRFITSSESLAKNIRRLLLLLGCHGRISKSLHDYSENKKFSRRGWKYQIVVSGESAGRLARLSKLENISPLKGKKLKELRKEWLTTGDTWKARIVSKTPADKARVYDLYCEGSDTWITEGYVQRGCGEQPLYPYDSCNLGSIDVSKMVKVSKGKTEIDWNKLRKIVRLAVRFLDNVIDTSQYPLKEIEERTKSIRRIGLGVMGFADLLIKLKVPYNSEEALKIAEDLMKFITEEGRKYSVELAEERGSFPEFENSIWKKRGYKKLRNSTITTIAPTSNLSIIAGCSHSIEPLFSISYTRNVESSLGTNLIETNPLFEKIAKEAGFYSEELMQKVLRSGSIQNIKEIPEDVRRIFVVSHDISPEWHVRMQAAFQKYTDNAVSKTVNCPYETTIEDIKKIFMLAYKLGCKGITVYRDGSRKFQVLNVAKNKIESNDNLREIEEIMDKTGACPTCHL